MDLNSAVSLQGLGFVLLGFLSAAWSSQDPIGGRGKKGEESECNQEKVPEGFLEEGAEWGWRQKESPKGEIERGNKLQMEFYELRSVEIGRESKVVFIE